MAQSLKAVIFDFDGLIVDTESVGYLSWKEIFQDHGHDLPPERYAQVVGTDFNESYDPRRDLEQLTGRTFEWPAMEATRRLREADLGTTLQVLPGVINRLVEAKTLGLRIAIASSSPRSWIDSWTRRLLIAHHFEHFSTVDDTGKVKPDPSLFQHAALSLAVKPEEVIVFEDSLNGLRAALSAGMRCLVVPGPMTRHLDFSGAWRKASTLEEVSLAEMLCAW